MPPYKLSKLRQALQTGEIYGSKFLNAISLGL